MAVRTVDFLSNEDVFPDHEKQLIEGIRKYTEPEESVVIVGGGIGPSTVVAARQVGLKGKVVTFEAATGLIITLRETVSLNKVENIVEIQQGIVEIAKNVRGDYSDSPHCHAQDLPSCDILILDCEGAEIAIIDSISSIPEKIIVETHAHFDASAENVKTLLGEKGYTIISEEQRSENISVIVAKWKAKKPKNSE